MDQREESIRWTEQDVTERLNEVRDKLLGFLRERTRLDWYKHKVQWRLSRSYIWPGAPEDFKARLDEAVEEDVGVEAFVDHLDRWKGVISKAIERYNWSLKRWLEQERGRPASDFDAESREILRRRQITFEGTKDDLAACAAQLTSQSGPELIGELLSLRLAILNEEVRDQLFAEVVAAEVSRKAGETPDMSQEEREVLGFEIEQRLRCCDQYHVARLLAQSYQEARRFLSFDPLLERYQEEIRAEREAPRSDPYRERRIQIIREVLINKVGFLESIFPHSRGTHDRFLALLKEMPGSTLLDPE